MLFCLKLLFAILMSSKMLATVTVSALTQELPHWITTFPLLIKGFTIRHMHAQGLTWHFSALQVLTTYYWFDFLISKSHVVHITQLVCVWPLIWSPRAQWWPWSGWTWSLWLAARYRTILSSIKEWKTRPRQTSTQVKTKFIYFFYIFNNSLTMEGCANKEYLFIYPVAHDHGLNGPMTEDNMRYKIRANSFSLVRTVNCREVHISL